MPVTVETSSSSTTIGDQIRLRRAKNQPITRHFKVEDDPPLTHFVPPISRPTRITKSAMSSFFLLPTSSNETTRKKPYGFPQRTSFRGMGCTAAASQKVSVPSVIRSSADWDATNRRDKKKSKNKAKKKNKGSYDNEGSVKLLNEARGVDGSDCVAIPDVWCGTRLGFSTDAVVSGLPRRNVPLRRKVDVDNNNSRSNNEYNQIEGSSVHLRRVLNQDSHDFLNSDSTFMTSRGEPALFSRRVHGHLRHPYPNDLVEMMMLQNGFVMGGTLESNDHFRDLRLDVDSMSYEQLLELGDRIGYVNTGLKASEIHRCLKKTKSYTTDTLASTTKCSICQEEYEREDEIGKLQCGHSFHVECVKQWLSRKNACPVCKKTAYMKKP